MIGQVIRSRPAPYGSPVTSPPSSSPLVRRINEAIAGTAAILTVLLAFTAHAKDASQLVLPMILWGIALTVAALPWTSLRISRLGAGIAAGTLLVLGVAVIVAPTTFVRPEVLVSPSPYISISPSPTASPPPAKPDLDITYPRPGQREVDACFQLEFISSAPDGWTFVVSNHRAGDNITYYEGEVVADDGRHWSAHTALAQGDPKATGALFDLAVWMLPKPQANYLLETHTKVETDETWWKSKEPPPGAIPVASITLPRSKKAECD
jgi:hypothetical protein